MARGKPVAGCEQKIHKQVSEESESGVFLLFLFLPCRLSILAQDLRQVVLHLIGKFRRWRLKFGLLDGKPPFQPNVCSRIAGEDINGWVLGLSRG